MPVRKWKGYKHYSHYRVDEGYWWAKTYHVRINYNNRVDVDSGDGWERPIKVIRAAILEEYRSNKKKNIAREFYKMEMGEY